VDVGESLDLRDHLAKTGEAYMTRVV
jgi:hypothetical protein